MRSFFFLITLSILFATPTVANSTCAQKLNLIERIQKEVYQCPMKCEGEKTYHKPGKCPVCGMNLKKTGKLAGSPNKSAMVRVTGAMKNVMRKGELFGTLSLDTISDKKNLFGLGPVENLKGEIMIYDGKSYISKIVSNSSMEVRETYKARAPFFVSANVSKWKEIKLPGSIQTMEQLEQFLEANFNKSSVAFPFKVSAIVNSGEIHIVNLPSGTRVQSPEDAHQGRRTFKLKNEQSDIIGFFSTSHQGVFTHHDSFVHMHLITADRTKMGHLDKALFKAGTAKLFIADSE